MFEAIDELATPDGPKLAPDLAQPDSEADPVEGTEMPRGRRNAAAPVRVRDASEYSDDELRELAKAGYDPFSSWRFDAQSDGAKRRLARLA